MKSYNPKKVRERLSIKDGDFLVYLLTKNGFVKIKNLEFDWDTAIKQTESLIKEKIIVKLTGPTSGFLHLTILCPTRICIVHIYKQFIMCSSLQLNILGRGSTSPFYGFSHYEKVSYSEL